MRAKASMNEWMNAWGGCWWWSVSSGHRQSKLIQAWTEPYIKGGRGLNRIQNKAKHIHFWLETTKWNHRIYTKAKHKIINITQEQERVQWWNYSWIYLFTRRIHAGSGWRRRNVCMFLAVSKDHWSLSLLATPIVSWRPWFLPTFDTSSATAQRRRLLRITD